MPVRYRPATIKLFIVLFLGLALWYGWRMVQAILYWNTLKTYNASPEPLYIAVSGGFWFLAWLFLVGYLYLGKSWGWLVAFGYAILFSGWYWFDRLILQMPHSNWPFALAFTVIFIFIFSLLFRHDVIQFCKRE